ncbi:MFS transporter [Burkholderia sp. 567]|uniref:MFS transporter n=1 Tax=Burkholderia sp. 567 TaxID=3156413 RepID=UPI003395C6C4
MRKVFLLALGMFALGLDAYVLAGLLPEMALDFHRSIGAMGQIVTAFTLSYALLSPALAVATAALDRRVVLVASLSVFALANVGSIVAPNFWMLILSRSIAGLAAGTYAPTAAATASGLVPLSVRGRALAIVLGGLTAATVAGVPFGLLIAAHAGWRMVLTVVIGLSAIAAASAAWSLPKIQAAVPGLRERFATLSHRVVLGRIGVMLCAATASLGLYTYFAPVFLTVSPVSPRVLPFFFFLWGIAGLAGNAMAGLMLDRQIDPNRILTAALCVLSIALLLLPFAAVNIFGAAIVIIVWGVAAWSLQVPLQHQLAQVAPDHISSTIALLASGVYLGSAIGSGVGAVVLHVSIRWVSPAAGATVVAALLLHLVTSSAGNRAES